VTRHVAAAGERTELRATLAAVDTCAGEMVCPPPNIGWSAVLLWTITVYGVLGIVSLFAAAVHWREPTATGTRLLRVLSLLDLGAAAAAPLLILLALDAPRAATAVAIIALALAALCRTAARRTAPTDLPPARALR
jgi:hypothetical protein